MKLGMLMVMAAMGLAAQVADGKVTVTVPFSFSAGGAKFAAGDYEVGRAAGSTSLTVRNRATRTTMTLAGGASRENWRQANGMEFKRYGESYFLTGVAFRVRETVVAVPVSDDERKAARSMAGETVIASTR